ATFAASALAAATLVGVSVGVAASPAAAVGDILTDGPNGDVTAIATAADGTTYLGGTFTGFGTQTGGGALVNNSTAAVNRTMPWVLGSVNAVLPDGSNGWYIGGVFTSVGGVSRTNLAHISSSGVVDAGWAPTIDGEVRALALTGAGNVVIGGTFTTVAGATRANLAQVNAAGAATSWAPNPDGSVGVVTVSGTTVYVGGQFANLGGAVRSKIGAVNAAGTATTWNPNANAEVLSLAVSGTTVYVGGYFTTIGGANRSYLAELDASGVATLWNPGLNGPANSIIVDGDLVYLAGAFTSTCQLTPPPPDPPPSPPACSGSARKRLAAIKASDGTVESWNPGSDGEIKSMVMSGTSLYLGGQFTKVAGSNRRMLAAVDTALGFATSWNPAPSGPDAVGAPTTVSSVAASGSNIYAGGTFTVVGTTARQQLAAYDGSGALTSWNPGADGQINALTVDGSTIYVGGAFQNLAGEARTFFGAVDSSGAATSLNPTIDGMVTAIAVDGGTTYVGGQFTSVNGTTRNSLVALDGTGAVTAWDPNPTQPITAMTASGGVIYVAGAFDSPFGDPSIGGKGRNYLAALNTSGSATDWAPEPDSPPAAIVVNGSSVYLGGYFQNVGGQARDYLAEVDSTTGTATDWNPSPDYWVFGLGVSGNSVYAGGDFGNVGGQARSRLAAISRTSGQPTSWVNPASNKVNAIGITAAGKVAVGGAFGTLNRAVASPQNGYLATLNASPDGPSVSALSPTGGPMAGGTVITFTGTNLTGTSAITFDGTPGTALTVDSATQVRVTTPAHVSASVDVSLTAPTGTINLPAAFTYSPPPTITTVSPDVGPADGGTTVTITGTDLGFVSAVTVGGVPVTGLSVDSDTQLTVIVPAGAAGAADVVVTSPSGSATKVGGFRYVAAPTVAAVTPAAGPVAGGTAVT
ncbi:MAG: IPT/TIG domain-containing protein, partial [Actinomycetes bacterium]